MGGKRFKIECFILTPREYCRVGLKRRKVKYPIISVCRSDGIGRRASFRD